MAMDYVPYYYDHLSEWLKTIFCGNFDKFQNSLRHLSDQDTQKLLSKRESLLNVSSLFHVIIGARTLYSDHPSIRMAQQLCNECLDVKTDHLKILYKLLSLNVDVNARDVAGFTPLHHCVQHLGNDTTYKMEELLIKAGANINAKNR